VIALIHAHILPAAYAVLPRPMVSRQATALLLAIGYQESRFLSRVQLGGPARGFWQFEQGGGTKAVLWHSETGPLARDVLVALSYRRDTTVWGIYDALAHNDILASAFARLLLWQVPGALPDVTDPEEGWRQYLAAWRPGKPKHASWADAWRAGWAAVEGE
jgi:hypothetical protein